MSIAAEALVGANPATVNPLGGVIGTVEAIEHDGSTYLGEHARIEALRLGTGHSGHRTLDFRLSFGAIVTSTGGDYNLDDHERQGRAIARTMWVTGVDDWADVVGSKVIALHLNESIWSPVIGFVSPDDRAKVFLFAELAV